MCFSRSRSGRSPRSSATLPARKRRSIAPWIRSRIGAKKNRSANEATNALNTNRSSRSPTQMRIAAKNPASPTAMIESVRVFPTSARRSATRTCVRCR